MNVRLKFLSSTVILIKLSEVTWWQDGESFRVKVQIKVVRKDEKTVITVQISGEFENRHKSNCKKHRLQILLYLWGNVRRKLYKVYIWVTLFVSKYFLTRYSFSWTSFLIEHRITGAGWIKIPRNLKNFFTSFLVSALITR